MVKSDCFLNKKLTERAVVQTRQPEEVFMFFLNFHSVCFTLLDKASSEDYLVILVFLLILPRVFGHVSNGLC